ncbi:hypothetical protein TNCV_5044161 [Trichonephila clavipes]|uniref:Uncharacterized protein n=1 Tax=Trichonephila clavipes TaxID=2585209 RepID=A0A8X7BK96_TRICX|nr:hypothetical protein TNCV_5044161 [Trichonephila clavipes]
MLDSLLMLCMLLMKAALQRAGKCWGSGAGEAFGRDCWNTEAMSLCQCWCLCFFPSDSRASLKVEYVPHMNVTRDVESASVFGKTILLLVQGPLHPVYFEAGGWRGNCAGHLTVGEIKGVQRLTSLRTSAPGCPVWATFPRETA